MSPWGWSCDRKVTSTPFPTPGAERDPGRGGLVLQGGAGRAEFQAGREQGGAEGGVQGAGRGLGQGQDDAADLDGVPSLVDAGAGQAELPQRAPGVGAALCLG